MIRIKTYTETFNIRGEAIKVTSNRKVNLTTGKLVFDEYLDNIATVKALNTYREKHHMIFPKQVKGLREMYGLSQRDFASLLGWSPTTIVAYEGGLLPSNGHNKVLQILLKNRSYAINLYKSAKANMSHLGQKRFTSFIKARRNNEGEEKLIEYIEWKYQKVNNTRYTGYTQFNLHKFAGLVIYFVSHMEYVTETKLCKLLYFSDFLNYGLQTVSITGVPYVKLPHGPVPDEYDILYKLLINRGLIKSHIKNFGPVDGTCYTSSRKLFDSQLFSNDELTVIRYIMSCFKYVDATSLSELSHKELGWQENKIGHNISYNYGNTSGLLKRYIKEKEHY